MESTGFHQAHYKSIKKLSSQTSSVSYIKRGMSISSPVAPYTKDAI